MKPTAHLQPSGYLTIFKPFWEWCPVWPLVTRLLQEHGPIMDILTQRVSLNPGGMRVVRFEARAAVQTDVYVSLCELHLLYPRRCLHDWLAGTYLVPR